MSYEQTRRAWAFIRRTPDLDSYAVAVLLALADRHNRDTGRCDPSLTMLATDCHMSRRGVQNSLRRLLELGVIVRDSGSVDRSNRYTLMLAPAARRPADRPPPDACGLPGDTPVDSDSPYGTRCPTLGHPVPMPRAPGAHKPGSNQELPRLSGPNLADDPVDNSADERRRAAVALAETSAMLRKKWGTG